MKLPERVAPYPPESAHDDVPLEVPQPTLEAAAQEPEEDIALDEERRNRSQEVDDACAAEEDESFREAPKGVVVDGNGLGMADRRDADDRHGEGFDHAVPTGGPPRMAIATDDQHHTDHGRGPCQAYPG